MSVCPFSQGVLGWGSAEHPQGLHPWERCEITRFRGGGLSNLQPSVATFTVPAQEHPRQKDAVRLSLTVVALLSQPEGRCRCDRAGGTSQVPSKPLCEGSSPEHPEFGREGPPEGEGQPLAWSHSGGAGPGFHKLGVTMRKNTCLSPGRL